MELVSVSTQVTEHTATADVFEISMEDPSTLLAARPGSAEEKGDD